MADIDINVSDRDAADKNISPADFANAIAGKDAEINLRIFDDKKRGVFKPKKLCYKLNELNDHLDKLNKYNAKGYGIFMVINSGGQCNAEITKINAQFMESDNGSFDEQLEKIKAFPLVPSIIVMTAKSLHTYWLMKDEADVNKFKDVQLALCKRFDGDPAVTNLSRVMRMPGFNHCKKDTPIKVVCVWWHPEIRYTQDELISQLPEYADSKAETVTPTSPGLTEALWGTQEGIENVLHCDFFEYCKENAATLTEPLWTAMISNIAPLAGGEQKAHELSQPYPKYSATETHEKIERVKKEEIKPYHCSTISKLGFDCPKLKKGECKVKSPIALCYKPLSIEAMTDILKTIPVAKNELKDTETAAAFIQKYMNKVPITIAKVFIMSEVMRHFCLNESTAKELFSELKKSRTKRNKPTNSNLPAWYKETEGSPMFMPGILAEHLKQTARIFNSTGQYYEYTDGYYKAIPDERVLAIIKHKMLPEYTKSFQINDVASQFRIEVFVKPDKLNIHPYLINIKNGLYDVMTKRLLDHNPDYLITTRLPVSYNAKAECPRFITFLEDAMSDNKDQIPLLQEIMGYMLVPINDAQAAFFLVGAGGAGKSVFLRTVTEILLGKDNVSNISWQDLNERFRLAEIYGKLANIFADLPTKAIEDSGIFKAIVGEDKVTAERKNKDPFSFTSTARLLFSCNNLPKNIADRSDGFFRRLIIIRWKHPVPEAKKDVMLLDKLRDEADGIFMFALEGLHRLMANGWKFSTTKANELELARYKAESDSAYGFVIDKCELFKTYSVGSTELWERYQAYCTEIGCKPFAQRTFISQLCADFSDLERGRDTTGKRRVINGIRIKDDED